MGDRAYKNNYAQVLTSNEAPFSFTLHEVPVGFAGGDIPQIPANILLVKNVTVCGLNMGYYFGWSPVDVREQYRDRLTRDVEQLCPWYQAGRISLATSHTFPLEQFQEAMLVVLQRRSLGRVVVLPEA